VIRRVCLSVCLLIGSFVRWCVRSHPATGSNGRQAAGERAARGRLAEVTHNERKAANVTVGLYIFMFTGA